jgi:hypothetical protein
MPGYHEASGCQPPLIRARVEADVQSDQVAVITGKPLDLCPNLVLGAAEVIEPVNDESPREPLAHLLDGMREPRSLVPIPVG